MVALAESVDKTAVGEIFHLLAQVEQHEDSGFLAYEGPDGGTVGSIVVAAGRVCFVRGVNGIPRFSELLANRHPESSKLLVHAVREARLKKMLIGEVLAGLNQVPLRHIRDCLRDQVARCLVGLVDAADAKRAPQWGALEGNFDERLTFTPCEMFVAAAHALDGLEDADIAVRLYKNYRNDSAFSVLAVRAGRALLPIAVSGIDITELAKLGELGRYLQSIGNPPTLQAAGIKPSIVSFGAGKEYGVVCVATNHAVLLGGLSITARAQIMREAVALSSTDF